MRNGCILLIIFMLSISSAFAQITADPDSGCGTLPSVQFTAPPGATDHFWDFDNGNFANDVANPTAAFNSGVYNVKYSGTLAGNTVRDTISIYVFDVPPTPGLTSLTPLTGCAPLTVQFADTVAGTNIVKWKWAYGNGLTDSTTTPDITYTYTIAGVFTVKLLVEDIYGCEAFVEKTQYVSTSFPPVARMSTTPDTTVSCDAPFDVTFRDSSINNSPSSSVLTYLWDFGDGTTSTVANPPTKTYSAEGIYTVTLTVADNNGCSATTTKTVTIGSPNASFAASGSVNDTVCDFVTFVNRSTGASFFYDYDDGKVGVTDTHTYANPGVYNVKLTAANGPCVDDTTIRIVVEEIVALFTSAPTYTCFSPLTVQFSDQSINAVEWSWEFGDDSTSTDESPSHTYVLNDTDRYFIYPRQVYRTTLTVTSIHGCTDTYTHPGDSLFRPTALFKIDTAEGCAPLEVTFTDSSSSFDSIVFFSWDFDDGTIISGATDSIVTHTFTAPGDYYTWLIIENERGCRDTSFQIHIRVGLPARPDFSISPTVTCPNEPVQFTDLTPPEDSVDTWHYDADNLWMSSCYTDQDPAWSFISDTGFMDITLTTGYNGCYTDTTIEDMIRVLGPIARFEVDCDCDSPFVVRFIGEIKGVDTLVWDFGDGTIFGTSTDYNPVHTYSATGDYEVTLSGINLTTGCDTFVTTKSISVRDVKAAFAGDSLFCGGVEYSFNAGASQDIEVGCHRGYRWVFEEGITPPIRTEDSLVTYTFTSPGIHEISLVVRDVNECYDTIRKTVNVYSIDANFTADTTRGCTPLTVNFTDGSTADTTISFWQWDFGDGDTSSNINTSHTFLDTFTVRLTVRDVLGCEDNRAVNIFPSGPVADFIPIGGNIGCTGTNKNFVFNPPSIPNQTYSWSFGDGDSVTTSNPLASNIFDVVGSYTVSLTVTDVFGCKDSIDKIIQVQGKPDAFFTTSADNLAALCYPIAINYTDSSTTDPPGVSYTRAWNLGTGAPTVGAPTVGDIYSQPGTYDVSLIVTSSAGCRDTFAREMVVRGPRGEFEMDRNIICKGDEIEFTIKDTFDVFNYIWDFGDGSGAADVSPVSHQYDFHPPNGRIVAQLTMYSENFTCPQTDTLHLFIYQVVADFNRNNESSAADTAHCFGSSDLFTNISQNFNSWTWDLGDGTTLSNTNPSPHTYQAPGIYDVRLTVGNNSVNCPDTIVKQMIIHPNPVASATGGAACEGETVPLSSSGGVQYVWIPDTGLSDDSIANPIASPEATTVYTVLVTDVNGCTDSTSVTVLIFAEPEELHEDTAIIIGDSAQLIHPLADDTNYVFTWDPNYNITCVDCPKPFVFPLDTTTYTVLVKDVLGCFEVPSTFEVIVLPLTSVDMPSAFTPNGDGHNDKIFPKGWGIKKLLSFQIYNRWGQLMYEVSDLENKEWEQRGWDGMYLGKLQNVDSYAYYVVVETFVDNTVLKKEGFISLLR